MPSAPPEELYARIWESSTEDDKLPAELSKTFSQRFNWEFVKLALLPSIQHYGKRVHQAVRNMTSTVERNDMFDVALEGKEALSDRDLILGNHQGPGEEGPGQGGLETVFGCELIPHTSRFVLKNEILQFRPNIKSIITALSQRKGKPIAVQRPNQDTSSMREYARSLAEERQRVFTEVFRVINEEECPVVVYPEGTRSSDGSILPFAKGLFETAIRDYVVPHMQTGQEPKIGMKVADTLQVFPEGRGKGAQLYHRKMTIRGLPYDAGELMDRISSCGEPLDSPDLPAKELGRFFCADVRSIIRDELSAILEESLST